MQNEESAIQEFIKNGGRCEPLTIRKPQLGDSVFTIHWNVGENAGPMVTLYNDGRMEFGPNYTPDEAARIFWDTVQRMIPPTLKFGG